MNNFLGLKDIKAPISQLIWWWIKLQIDPEALHFSIMQLRRNLKKLLRECMERYEVGIFISGYYYLLFEIFAGFWIWN